jgi:hypothetical protein
MLVPILAAAPLTHAETQYVIEQLVVNVSSAPDSSGERVATIKSGDAVEVLDRQGDQVHVHLANGAEGWVRKSYLSAEEPLQHRLNERTKEVEKLKQDVARLTGELASARAGGRGAKSDGQPALGPTRSGSGSNATAAATSGVASPTSAPKPAGRVGGSSPAGTATAGISSKVANGSAPDPTPPVAATPDGSHGGDGAAEPASGEPSYFMTPPDEPARPVWHWALGSFVVALGLGFVLGWQVLDRRIRRKYGGLRIY